MYIIRLPTHENVGWTNRSCVDEDDYQDHEQHNDDSTNNVPLVVLPDDVFQRLQRGGKPEEGGSGAVGLLKVRVLVGFVTCLGSRLQESIVLGQNLNLQLQFTLR